ncbi:hypothetical protein V8C43DRAFT_315514 [Trichoderma afarasin]
MHYRRLLKSPAQSQSGKKHTLDLIFTIIVNLGGWAQKGKLLLSPLPRTAKLQWRPGVRVAKHSVDISAANVCISTETYSALGVRDISATTVLSEEGPSHDEADIKVTTRRLPLPEPSGVEALKGLFTGPKPVNALELGCRVEIFGKGLSVVFPRTLPPPSRRCTILMTDLEEAESQTRSNIMCFGPEAESHRWDLVLLSDCVYNVDMLPALLGTLSALHEPNTAETGEQRLSTKVFLATKTRHASGEALFGLLSDQGWTERLAEILGFCVLSFALK